MQAKVPARPRFLPAFPRASTSRMIRPGPWAARLPRRRRGCNASTMTRGATCPKKAPASRWMKWDWGRRPLAQVPLAQVAQALEGGLGLPLVVEQAAVGELVRVGVGPVGPLHP